MPWLLEEVVHPYFGVHHIGVRKRPKRVVASEVAERKEPQSYKQANSSADEEGVIATKCVGDGCMQSACWCKWKWH